MLSLCGFQVMVDLLVIYLKAPPKYGSIVNLVLVLPEHGSITHPFFALPRHDYNLAESNTHLVFCSPKT